MMNEREKLPEGWKRVKLGEVVEKIKEVSKKGSLPYLEIGDIDVERKDYTLKNKPSPDHCLKARKNFVVISKVRPTRGAIAKIKEEVLYVSPAFMILSCEFNNFLFYALSRTEFFNFLGVRETGTTYPSVKDNDILDFDILLPENSDEQQKIAEILETVDNAIEKSERIIEKYKRIKQGLMQDLLTRGIDENGQIRNEQTHKFKDTPIGRIPEEWEVVRLGEIVEIFDSRRIPLDSQHRLTIKGDIPYYGATGVIDYINDYIFNGDYVLIAEDGGKFNRFEETAYIIRGKFWANNHVHVVKGKDGILDDSYLMYFINFQDISYYISGTTREKLNQQLLRFISFPLPPLPEQQRIASILSQIDEAIEKEIKYKEKLERIKQGLMEDLLTGKVRVNHLIFKQEVEV